MKRALFANMENLLEKIISLTKRRGFIFQSSEIYGGFGSCYDFGPLGVEMKNNIKKAWWDEMTKKQENIVGLDAAILMSPQVWQASGHLSAGFADPLVECKKCHHRYRADQLEGVEMKQEKDKSGVVHFEWYANNTSIKCPSCGGPLDLRDTEFGKKLDTKQFNLMMKTFVGSVEDEATTTYLRAETCQGIYLNFLNVLNSMRLKVPFGIAQVGKAFRNEITPGNFIYRTREFEQMEMQWFCNPKTADQFFESWKKSRMDWYLSLGVKEDNLHFREVPKEDLAHYAKRAVDIEYKFPFGWKEIEGIHNRGDWDLSNHAKHSKQDLRYFDEETKEKYYPHIIETSAGADRSFLTFLVDAYSETKGGRTKTTESAKETEVTLKLDKSLAPIKIAVFPLVKNKAQLTDKAKELFELLKIHFVCQYDEVGSIGRRYRRQDEIGTLWSVTVDFDTLEKDDVTVRDRDTMEQERVKTKDLVEFFKNKLGK